MKRKMKAIVALGLSVMMICGSTVAGTASHGNGHGGGSGGCWSNKYHDVKQTDWHCSAVDYVCDNGYFFGTGSSQFSPDATMTRGMFATVLGRKSNVAVAQYTGCRFSDCDAKAYYTPYVEWAAANNIMQGKGDGRFDPNSPITREEMGTILYRYAQATGNNTSITNHDYQNCKDWNQVSGWASTGMQWAYCHSLIRGANNGVLSPRGHATRAQVAQVLLSSDGLLKNTQIKNH